MPEMSRATTPPPSSHGTPPDLASTEPETHGLVGRRLPVAEWTDEKLGHTSLAEDYKAFDPEHCVIAVVEDASGTVIRCWCALTAVFMEGLWATPEHQGHAGSARLLFETMIRELQANAVKEVLTRSLDPRVDALIEHVGGAEVPGRLWTIPIPAPDVPEGS